MRGRPVWPQSLALLTIAACTPANEIARQGRQIVIGMDASTLQSCAGIPTRIAQLDPRTQLYSYENKYERTGGLEITLPIIGGGIAAGGSGSYCHALVRIVDGKVAGVTYTGDNDDMIGREGVCGPILRGCLRGRRNRARRAQPGRADRASGGWSGGAPSGGRLRSPVLRIESPPAWLRRVARRGMARRAWPHSTEATLQIPAGLRVVGKYPGSLGSRPRNPSAGSVRESLQ